MLERDTSHAGCAAHDGNPSHPLPSRRLWAVLVARPDRQRHTDRRLTTHRSTYHGRRRPRHGHLPTRLNAPHRGAHPNRRPMARRPRRRLQGPPNSAAGRGHARNELLLTPMSYRLERRRERRTGHGPGTGPVCSLSGDLGRLAWVKHGSRTVHEHGNQQAQYRLLRVLHSKPRRWIMVPVAVRGKTEHPGSQRMARRQGPGDPSLASLTRRDDAGTLRHRFKRHRRHRNQPKRIPDGTTGSPCHAVRARTGQQFSVSIVSGLATCAGASSLAQGAVDGKRRVGSFSCLAPVRGTVACVSGDQKVVIALTPTSG